MAKNLLSQELTDVLNLQMSAEIYNSNLYLFIAGYLKNKGLDNLAEKFIGQWKEETEHSKLIFDFLTDMNAKVVMEGIDTIDLDILSISDIANYYIDRELLTTTSLEGIKDICISDKNGVAEEFLRQMVDRQRTELEEANTFSDQAELCGNDWKFVFLWDRSL